LAQARLLESQVESQGRDREKMSAIPYHPEAPADVVDSMLYFVLPFDGVDCAEVAVNVLLLLLWVLLVELTCHRGAQAALGLACDKGTSTTTTQPTEERPRD